MKYLALAGLLACTTNGAQPPDGSSGGGSDGPTDGSVADDAPPMVSHGISIIVEPNGNKGDEVVTAIAAAKSSVYMTMYEINDSDVIDALVARKKAGLDVQAILDVANKSFNTSAYNTLSAGGVNVVWSSSDFTYTHEKTIMIDGTTAWIMTMNMNNSSPAENREYLAIDTAAADVAEAIQIFQADHARMAIAPNGPLVVADTNARQKLVNFIYTATSSIDIEGEELSDTNTNGVVDALDAAAHRGVTVHAVIANGELDPTSVARMKNSGVSVVETGPTSGNGTATNPYIHAKAIVVDGTTAFVGSENFSAGSLGYNRELGVIFDDQAEVTKVKTAIDTDFGKGVAQ